MSYDISTLKKGDYTKFQRFLENENKRKEFKSFLVDRHCSENLEAWELINEYKKVDNIINAANIIFSGDNNDFVDNTNNNSSKVNIDNNNGDGDDNDNKISTVVKKTTSADKAVLIVSDDKMNIANKILKQYIRFDNIPIVLIVGSSSSSQKQQQQKNTPIDITERKRNYIEQIIKKGMYPNDLFDSIQRELFITMLMDSFRKYNDWIDSNQQQQQHQQLNNENSSSKLVYKTSSLINPDSNCNNNNNKVIVVKRVSLSSNVTRVSSVDDNQSNKYNSKNKNNQQQLKNSNNSTSIHDVILKLKASLSNSKSDEKTTTTTIIK